MSNSDYGKKFQQLERLFVEVYSFFYIWKGLQDKSFEIIYSENPRFWSATLFALENNWLIGLAKIYEKSKYSEKEKIVSVFALLPHQLNIDYVRAMKVLKIILINLNVIENIKKLRDNQLGHNNAEHLINPKRILRKYPIRYKEVERLILISGKVLANLNPLKSVGYEYNRVLVKECINDSKYIIRKLKYYSKCHKEWVNKIKNGEISPTERFDDIL